MRRLGGCLLMMVLIAWGLLLMARATQAVPAFARKYQTTCARCHTAYPKLNAYGEAFKMRGYQTLGETGRIGVIASDDDLLTLIREFPLSARVSNTVRLPEGAPADFSTGTGISLFAGGTLARDIGYLADYGEGLEKWNLTFSNLTHNPREPTQLNLSIGQFALMDWVFTEHRALTFNTAYQVYFTGVGGFNLGGQQRGFYLYGTQDSGIGVEQPAAAAEPTETEAEEATAAELQEVLREFAEETGEEPAEPPTEAGAEITFEPTSYDRRQGWFWQAGLVNGNGPAADNNRHKDSFVCLAYRWKDQRVGAFAYSGKSIVESAQGRFNNNLTRLALDFDLYFGEPRHVTQVANPEWNVFGLVAWGRDSNPLGALTPQRSHHAGGFLEADYLIDGRSLALARYDWVRSGDLPEIERSALTLNYTYYLRRNVKLGMEGTLDFERDQRDSLALLIETVF